MSRRPPLLSRPFVLCSIANLLQGIAFNLFLHFPGFLKDLGAGEVQIGWIFGLTALASIGVRPAVGRIMDTRGRRTIILAGSFLHVAVIGLYLPLDSLGLGIYAVRILHGLAEALLFTSLFTFAADQVPESRLTEGLALFGVSGMLPISLGGVLGDWLLGAGGYTLLFQVSLAFAVLSCALSLPLYDAPRPAVGTEGEGAPAFRSVLLRPELATLWWVTTVFSVALAAMFAFLKTFVMTTGIGSVGGFFTAYTIAALILRVFFGWLPDRVGPKRVLFPALAALALGFLLLGLSGTAFEVQLAGVFCGIGHGYAFPVLFGMVVSRTPERERGTAMAIYTALFDVGVLIGGPALGAAIAAWGYPGMFAAGGAWIAGGSLLFARLDRGRR